MGKVYRRSIGGPSSGGTSIGTTTVVQTLNAGNNTVTHGRGVVAIDVIVKTSAGAELDTDWNVDPANPLTKVIIFCAGGPYANAIINIITT